MNFNHALRFLFSGFFQVKMCWSWGISLFRWVALFCDRRYFATTYLWSEIVTFLLRMQILLLMPKIASADRVGDTFYSPWEHSTYVYESSDDLLMVTF